jgi:hypothetical protein
LSSAERRHVEQEVGVQQRVHAARVREGRRTVGPREGLVKANSHMPCRAVPMPCRAHAVPRPCRAAPIPCCAHAVPL